MQTEPYVFAGYGKAWRVMRKLLQPDKNKKITTTAGFQAPFKLRLRLSFLSIVVAERELNFKGGSADRTVVYGFYG